MYVTRLFHSTSFPEHVMWKNEDFSSADPELQQHVQHVTFKCPHVLLFV